MSLRLQFPSSQSSISIHKGPLSLLPSRVSLHPSSFFRSLNKQSSRRDLTMTDDSGFVENSKAFVEISKGTTIDYCCSIVEKEFNCRSLWRHKHMEEEIHTIFLCFRTTIMAKDTIAMLDRLGWSIEHVFGHSMVLAESGGMIACKVAAMAPDRIQSLALLNVTGGGFQCFPKKYLVEVIGSNTRRSVLYQVFVGNLDTNVVIDDYLRQAFSQYGELVHVKIVARKRCGFIQFVNRHVNSSINQIIYELEKKIS